MTKIDGERSDLPSSSEVNFQSRVRETLMTYLGKQGDRLDRGVTLRDLVTAGVVKLRDGFLSSGRGNPIGGIGTAFDDIEPDLTPPPAPTGFTATGAISHVVVECAAPTYTVGHGHLQSNLYGVTYTAGDPLPVFANAARLGEFGGTVFAHPSNPSTTWRMWLKWQSKDGVESAPAGGTNGVEVKTGQDVRSLLDAITAAAESPTAPFSKMAVRAGLFYVANDTPASNKPVFSVVTTPIVMNGVTVGVGVYMADGFIMNGTITNALIANLAVDNAKVANMSVSKLIAGSIAVGQYAQSTGFASGSAGWRINGDGNAEFNNVVVRGGVYAGYGLIGGISITSVAIQSNNYNAAGAGFQLHSNGTLTLPNGSVNAQALNVGVGRNLLDNSTWADRNGAVPTSWEYGIGGLSSGQWDIRSTPEVFPDYCPPSSHGVVLYQAVPGSGAAGGVGGAGSDQVMVIQSRVSVEPGQRYEFSVYCGAHRCFVWTDVLWLDGFGGQIGSSGDLAVRNSNEQYGGRTLGAFKRIGHFGTAPAGAATGLFRIIKYGTYAGQADSYAFLVNPMVAPASPNQLVFSPYSPSGLGTRITPQGIVTPSVSALSSNFGVMQAGIVEINHDGAGGWGFIRSPGKWRDANWGWILARHGNGSQFIDFTMNGMKLVMHYDVPAASAAFELSGPGFSLTNSGLAINQVDVIGTLNLQGNAVTVPAVATSGGLRTGTSNLFIYGYNGRGAPVQVLISGVTGADNTETEGGGGGFNPNGRVVAYRNGVLIINQTFIGTRVYAIQPPDGPADYQFQVTNATDVTISMTAFRR